MANKYELPWSGEEVENRLKKIDSITMEMEALERSIDNKVNNDHLHDDVYYSETEVDNLLSSKVEVEEGKGLSTNDYTNEDKNKLTSVSNDVARLNNAVDSLIGLPDINNAANGSFLCLIDGIPQWKTLPKAEEEAF